MEIKKLIGKKESTVSIEDAVNKFYGLKLAYNSILAAQAELDYPKVTPEETIGLDLLFCDILEELAQLEGLKFKERSL